MESSVIKSAVFARYKKTVKIIAGNDGWDAEEGFYIQTYNDFMKFRRGGPKLLHLLYFCLKTMNKSGKKASAKYLNKLLTSVLAILRSEGFEEVKP